MERAVQASEDGKTFCKKFSPRPRNASTGLSNCSKICATSVLLLLLVSRSSSLLRACWVCKLLHIQQAISTLEERPKSNNNTVTDFGQRASSGPFDPYKILGLPPTATPQQIKAKYHQLALRFHPDSGTEGSKERFQAVNEAYEAVKDGKWSGQHPRARDGEGGAGYDPMYRTYVYERPGSTTDNYVSKDGRLQTLLRLMLVWCGVFFVLRMFLLYFVPQKRDTKSSEHPKISAEMAGGRQQISVHDEEDEG